MRALIRVALVLAGTGVQAQGLAIKDFAKVQVNDAAFAQGTYGHQSTRGRIMTRCDSCTDWTLMNVLLGTSTDGTEGRFRSGETTVQHMEALCKRNVPSCTLRRIDIGTAVGWLTEYESGESFGTTAMLLLNGDCLTLGFVSENTRRARQNMKVLLGDIVPQIVGAK